MHKKLPKAGRRGAGGQRRHQTSPAYVRIAQEMRLAERLARYVREDRRVGWLVERRRKIKALGIHLPHLAAEGEGLGQKGWNSYAEQLEKRAEKLRRKLHGDLRKQMKNQRAGREVKLANMMQADGGGREGAAIANAMRRRRDGAVDIAVIREEEQDIQQEGVEGCEVKSKMKVRAARSGKEVRESTQQFMKK